MITRYDSHSWKADIRNTLAMKPNRQREITLGSSQFEE